jgi:monoamine oxidase
MPFSRRDTLRSALYASAGMAAARPVFATPPKLDVAIVGAGLAGLHAAIEHTLNVDGERFDTGGVEVGAGYTRLLAVAERLNVTIEKPTGIPLPSGLALDGGALINAEEWEKSPLNRLPERERKTPPHQLLMAALGGPNPLTKAADWLKPEHAALDVSLWDYLGARGWSASARQWMDIAANFSSLKRVSALDCLRRDALRREGIQTVVRIAGGSQMLTTAMSNALAEPIRFAHQLVAIHNQKDGVRLRFQNGEDVVARSAILTLPTGPLSRVRFDPALPPDQAQAFAERLSTGITQIHLKPLKPYWERDGLPPNLWLASPIERLLSIADSSGQVMRQVLWINGDRARTLDGFNDRELADWALLELARMRPASKGQVRVLAVNSWSRNPFAGGAYAEIAAGRCASTALWTAQPHGRIHFAGEHTEFSEPGMESALKSAERVADEVQAALD